MTNYYRDEFTARFGYGTGRFVLDRDGIEDLQEDPIEALVVHLGSEHILPGHDHRTTGE